jgi:ABC-type lipoprotein export system ATPase subunit
MSLNISQLKKSYRSPDGQSVPVIDLPSFTLDDGEQVSLIGGSGCGKTTLLHLIAGILSADSGRIEYSLGAEGVVEIGGLGESQRDVFRGRNIGYVYQTHHLLPGFTALENVLLGMSFTGRPHDPAWARRLLGEVGLANRLHYKPEKLSVGQQQRVAVARALANRPRLVLADEPTGALDPRTAQLVLELIRNLCREVNASLLLVSHDLAIARQLPRTLALAEINQALGAARGTPAGAAA